MIKIVNKFKILVLLTSLTYAPIPDWIQNPAIKIVEGVLESIPRVHSVFTAKNGLGVVLCTGQKGQKDDDVVSFLNEKELSTHFVVTQNNIKQFIPLNRRSILDLDTHQAFTGKLYRNSGRHIMNFDRHNPDVQAILLKLDSKRIPEELDREIAFKLLNDFQKTAYHENCINFTVKITESEIQISIVIAAHFFETYLEYSKTEQNWLVTRSGCDNEVITISVEDTDNPNRRSNLITLLQILAKKGVIGNNTPIMSWCELSDNRPLYGHFNVNELLLEAQVGQRVSFKEAQKSTITLSKYKVAENTLKIFDLMKKYGFVNPSIETIHRVKFARLPSQCLKTDEWMKILMDYFTVLVTKQSQII